MRVIGVLAPSGDTEAPTQPQNLQATAINRQRVDLSWTASTDNVGVAGYQIFRDGSPLTTTDQVTHSDTTATASTTYTYTVVAFDAAGNNSVPSASAQATTPANASPSWQTIPDQTLIVGDSFTLNLNNFCTDADADTIQYSETSGTYPTGITRSGAVISGTPSVAGQDLTVTIDAFDGFVHVGASISFATKSADVTAPPVPTGLAAGAGSTSVSLTWNASTDVAGSANELVSGTQDYRVYRSTDGTNFSLRTTVSSPSYLDTGLASGTTYHYKVSSRDVALNESAQSSSVNATTSVFSQSTITTLSITSGAASGNRPWTFGQGFYEGDAPAGAFVTTDATQSQADVRNRWPDGSVKYAVLSGIGAFTQNVKKTFTIAATPNAPTGSNVAEPTSVDVVLTLTGDGAGTYTLQSCLGVDRSTWSKVAGGRIRQIPGRVMSEFHYYLPTSDTHLAIFWFVRRYVDGSVEVETAVDNAWLDVASPGTKSYGVTLAINGSTVYSNGAVSHQHHRRWYHVDWLGTDPLCVPEHDVAYYRHSRLMPNYETPAPDASAFTGLSTAKNPAPFALGDWNAAMGSGGEQQQIGPVPYHDAHYCANAHPTAYAAAVSNSRCAGRWEIHHRDETTGRPARWEPYGSRSLLEGWGGQFPGTAKDSWDTPHHPSQGYVPYLIEGRWSQLEELQFLASAMMLSSNPATRFGAGVLPNINSPLTTRGQAWAIRSVSFAAGISPTRLNDVVLTGADAALQLSYATCIANTAAWERGEFVDAGAPQFNIVGWSGEYGEGDQGPPNEFWGRVWMRDYQGMAWCIAAEMKIEGVAQANIIAVRDFHYKHVVRRCGDTTTWNYRRLGLYNMPYQIRSPLSFMSASQALSAYESFLGLSALTANPGDALKNQESNVDVTPSSSTNGISGYLGQSVALLSMAAGDDAPGARAGHALVTAASNFETSKVGVNNKPTFGGIKPRWPRTEFAKAARKLRPGQCIRVSISLPDAVFNDNAAPFIKWGDSMVWDGIARELRYTGKRENSQNVYRFLRIYELTNTADRNTPPWDTSPQSGHGYDHNTYEPATGTLIVRPYNDSTLRLFYNDAWTNVASTATMDIACGLAYVPSYLGSPPLGVIAMDGKRVRRLPVPIRTSAWQLVYQWPGDPGNAYHTIAEYNRNSDLVLYGGGNLPGNPVYTHSRAQILANQVPTSRPAAPWEVGSAEGQGNCCADPNGPGWVILEKATRNNRYFNPNTNAYTSLPIATGDGSSAADGFPPVTTGTGNVGRSRLCCPIDEYRVQAWLEYLGGSGGNGAALWFYMPPTQS